MVTLAAARAERGGHHARDVLGGAAEGKLTLSVFSRPQADIEVRTSRNPRPSAQMMSRRPLASPARRAPP
jgi:hypothetical protein